MSGTDDDDESDENLRKELIEARDNLRRQLEILAAGPVGRYARKSDFDQEYASLAEELKQVEAELAKYPGEPASIQGDEPDQAANDPESTPEAETEAERDREAASDPLPVISAPIQFHTDAPDGPPENGQFWTFAGMGVVALLALALLLRIFSMLWAHLMGHPTY